MKKLALFSFSFFVAIIAFAQNKQYTSSKFEQLGTILPTPNNYRTASGAPGHEYWQQKADYKIKAELNDEDQTLKGAETITYYNYSPDDLNYLWLQLDQNRFKKDALGAITSVFGINENSLYALLGWMRNQNSMHGYEILSVKDANGKDLPYTINQTMMRIDLPATLKAKTGVYTFSIEWKFKIVDAQKAGSRGGLEYFEKDNNYLYEMAQWFPRMAVYHDAKGWQHHQFWGGGEFALTFGDYEVNITVPADHIVGATGELQNAKDVLTSEQLSRWEKAKTATSPVLIVTQAEAEQAEKNKAKNTKTWVYKAKNVRDFAFASSRKFIWDAMTVDVAGNKVWAMSYYPKEGNPLWGQYSTNVVALTLKVYSKHTINYPYPVAISVHGPIFGMEYPMICFNGGRPNADGTVSDNTRNGMISVIIHEVGHNFFPMIVNSDERQWNWMDEGLNSFCQFLTEKEIPMQDWAKKDYPSTYPSRRGPAANIVNYMKSDNKLLVPIMTTSDLVAGWQLGNNAYGKPATALNILRETVLGKELFDHAFKTYSQRWAFKHPEPADFFRTLEDASGTDLDWFWRGWFYSTEPCDISLEKVQQVLITQQKVETTKRSDQAFDLLAVDMPTLTSKNPNLRMSEEEKQALTKSDNWWYLLELKNVGGLVMPVIVQLNYKDGTNEIIRIPAEIWRFNNEQIAKLIAAKKEVSSIVIDPNLETADINTENNLMPRKSVGSQFMEFKNNQN
ncbi:MAG: M1 family peptidase [Cytophagales bacterium]|nr:MAG: M1 family peptidase [Cytophagales bacterium]